MSPQHLPEHGTAYRYKGAKDGSWPGCHCRRCVRNWTAAGTRRALAHLNGTPPLYPAGPLTAHINACLATGMSRSLIARRASVATSTISYLLRGLTQSCLRDKALRILAVAPGDFDGLSDRPANGARRRIQALYAIGHGASRIAAVGRLDPSNVSHIANGHSTSINGRVHEAIVFTYQKLASTPGMSYRATQMAEANRWPDPTYWEDTGAIDDPDHDPQTPEPAHSRSEKISEDAAWLAQAGLDRGQIAERLGISRDHLCRVIARARDAA